MTWATELAKTENDALRTSGDLSGLLAKYGAPSGPVTWRATPLSTLLDLAGATIAGWTAQNWAALKRDHTTPAANVKTAQEATRTFLQPLLTADEWTALSDVSSSQDTLADTLGLKLNRREIRSALEAAVDSPQGADRRRYAALESIRTKLRTGARETTSVTNLETIDSLLGT